MVELLVNIDRGNVGGKGATTKVGLAQGRVTDSFQHGRGVRQGSVGGPLKWCVMVNFWLEWVQDEMKGKGYVMSANKRTESVKKAETDKPAHTEVQGMKFIDDAAWPFSSAEAINKVIDMHETFCSFHGINLNKSKSELFSINARKGHPKITWGEKETVTLWNGGEITRRAELNSSVQSALKYLGIWYDMDSTWKTQTRAMSEKLKQLLKDIKTSSASIRETIYAVNSVVISTLA